jgi:hypothetical protein
MCCTSRGGHGRSPGRALLGKSLTSLWFWVRTQILVTTNNRILINWHRPERQPILIRIHNFLQARNILLISVLGDMVEFKIFCLLGNQSKLWLPGAINSGLPNPRTDAGTLGMPFRRPAFPGQEGLPRQPEYDSSYLNEQHHRGPLDEVFALQVL